MQYYLAIGSDTRAERMPGIYETEDSAIMAAKRETVKLSAADERFIRVIEDTPMGLVVYATKTQQQERLATGRALGSRDFGPHSPESDNYDVFDDDL